LILKKEWFIFNGVYHLNNPPCIMHGCGSVPT